MLEGGLSHSRRRIQAEHIVNSLKLKPPRFHLTTTKKLKKTKRKHSFQKTIPVLDGASIGHVHQQQSPWFRDDDGRNKTVHFVLNKPTMAVSLVQNSDTFSSMFRLLAQKFKPGNAAEPPLPKLIYDKVQNCLFFGNNKDTEPPFEVYKESGSIRAQNPISSLVEKLDFEGLKHQYKLSYLY